MILLHREYTINEIADELKVGDVVKTNGSGMEETHYGELVEGVIGRIEGGKFYVYNNTLAGTVPVDWEEERSRYRQENQYAWEIDLNNRQAFIIINERENMPTNPYEKFDEEAKMKVANGEVNGEIIKFLKEVKAIRDHLPADARKTIGKLRKIKTDLERRALQQVATGLFMLEKVMTKKDYQSLLEREKEIYGDYTIWNLKIKSDTCLEHAPESILKLPLKY